MANSIAIWRSQTTLRRPLGPATPALSACLVPSSAGHAWCGGSVGRPDSEKHDASASAIAPGFVSSALVWSPLRRRFQVGPVRGSFVSLRTTVTLHRSKDTMCPIVHRRHGSRRERQQPLEIPIQRRNEASRAVWASIGNPEPATRCPGLPHDSCHQIAYDYQRASWGWRVVVPDTCRPKWKAGDFDCQQPAPPSAVPRIGRVRSLRRPPWGRKAELSASDGVPRGTARCSCSGCSYSRLRLPRRVPRARSASVSPW